MSHIWSKHKEWRLQIRTSDLLRMFIVFFCTYVKFSCCLKCYMSLDQKKTICTREMNDEWCRKASTSHPYPPHEAQEYAPESSTVMLPAHFNHISITNHKYPMILIIDTQGSFEIFPSKKVLMKEEEEEEDATYCAFVEVHSLRI